MRRKNLWKSMSGVLAASMLITAAPVTAMAEDSQTIAIETQADMQSDVDQSQETPEGTSQETGGEAVDAPQETVPEDTDAGLDQTEEATDPAGEVPEDGTDETPAEETTEEASQPDAEVTEETQPETDITAQTPEDGWYVDENGNTFLYIHGAPIQSMIYEYEGSLYWFDYDGKLLKNGRYSAYLYDEQNKTYIYSNIRAGADGKLYIGWYQNGSKWEYYGTNGLQYLKKILTDNNKKYYFDENGDMLVNGSVIVDNVQYQAGADGVLTEKGAVTDGWHKSDNAWYWYKDGKPLTSQFLNDGGNTYYLEDDGKMATGYFIVYEEGTYTYKCWLAETSGVVVKHAKGWYQANNGSWYYFTETNHIARDQVVQVGSNKFWFAWNGVMETGYIQYYDEKTGNYVYGVTDANGAIQSFTGWKAIDGNWYYTDKNGQIATNELKDIGGKTYYFDYDGKMQTGKIWTYTDEGQKIYFADDSGAIIKSKWVQDGLTWYYANADGTLFTGWLNGKYYLNSDGSMSVGNQTIDGKSYYFDDSGLLVSEIGKKNGWEIVDGTWYYIKDGQSVTGIYGNYYISNGKMLIDQVVYDSNNDTYYYVNYKGEIQKNGWVKNRYGEWMYADASGKLVSNAWKVVNGRWYYFQYVYMATQPIWDNDVLYDISSDGTYIGAVKANKGWKQTSDGSWYYFNQDGTVNKETEKAIGGRTYYFYSDGRLETSTYKLIADKTYTYLDANGFRVDNLNGWKLFYGYTWYYLVNGKAVTGFQNIGGKVYYFFDGGSMATGQIYADGKQYFCDASGEVHALGTGWKSITRNNYTYWYYYENGVAANGKKVIGGTTYYFSGGQMYQGIRSIGSGYSNARYIFDKNGQLVRNRWYLQGNYWYYGNANGRVLTGEQKIGGTTYWFSDSGVWIK